MKVICLILVTLGCALAAPKPRIVNGEDATRNEFPYQVSYQYGFGGVNQHMCGGTILSPTWILTAGHCVTEAPSRGDFTIYAGLLDITETPEQTAVVDKKVVHANFTGGVGPNDIALLHLATPLTWSDGVQKANLPEEGVEPSEDAVLSGWGALNNVIFPIMPRILQKVSLPIIGQDECASTLKDILQEDSTLDAASNICTSGAGGKSACSGDSGGPLAQNSTVVGVVSWGIIPCGSKDAPTVFTKVSNFLAFIKENVDDL